MSWSTLGILSGVATNGTLLHEGGAMHTQHLVLNTSMSTRGFTALLHRENQRLLMQLANLQLWRILFDGDFICRV